MKTRVCGPTLLVPIGDTGVMTVSAPGADPHLEWSLRYGSPEAVRFLAASVVESFDYLLSSNINMAEATRRLRLLRAAVRGHVSGVPAWDASQIKPPGWDHVFAAFVEGAREARANPEATEDDFRRAADGHTKRVFEEVDPVSEKALRTESWRAEVGSPISPSDDQLARQEMATELATAFADLPDALRAHPGVKRLYRAAVGTCARGAAEPGDQTKR